MNMIKEEFSISSPLMGKVSGEFNHPAGNGPWPAVLLSHGSGKTDRDATVKYAGNIVSQNYKLIAEFLVSSGFAVIRYDKQSDYSIEEAVEEARATLGYLCNRPNLKKIFVYGWSQGAQVAVELAKEFTEIEGLILHAGIARGWPEYFEYILKDLAVQQLILLDNDNDGILQLQDFEKFAMAPTSMAFCISTLVLARERGNYRFNSELDPCNSGQFSIQDNWLPLAKSIVDDPTTLKRFTDMAPKKNWYGIESDVKALKIPVLILHGRNDGWVSPKAAMELHSAIAKQGQVCIFDKLGHSLSPTESPLHDIGGVIDGAPLEIIREWLNSCSNLS